MKSVGRKSSLPRLVFRLPPPAMVKMQLYGVWLSYWSQLERGASLLCIFLALVAFLWILSCGSRKNQRLKFGGDSARDIYVNSCVDLVCRTQNFFLLYRTTAVCVRGLKVRGGGSFDPLIMMSVPLYAVFCGTFWLVAKHLLRWRILGQCCPRTSADDVDWRFRLNRPELWRRHVTNRISRTASENRIFENIPAGQPPVFSIFSCLCDVEMSHCTAVEMDRSEDGMSQHQHAWGKATKKFRREGNETSLDTFRKTKHTTEESLLQTRNQSHDGSQNSMVVVAAFSKHIGIGVHHSKLGDTAAETNKMAQKVDRGHMRVTGWNVVWRNDQRKLRIGNRISNY